MRTGISKTNRSSKLIMNRRSLNRRSLFVVLAVLLISISPTIGFAKDTLLDEARKLVIHDSKIHDDVSNAAWSMERCVGPV